jgi:hypothetical protein
VPAAHLFNQLLNDLQQLITLIVDIRYFHTCYFMFRFAIFNTLSDNFLSSATTAITWSASQNVKILYAKYEKD